MIRRTVIVAAATLSVIAAPGIANAVPGEPGECSGTGYCLNVEPPSNGVLDGASVAVPPPTLGEKVSRTLGTALADFLFGPRW